MSRTVVSTSDSLGRPSSWAQTRAALSISSQLLDVAPEFRSWHRRRAIDQVLDVFASVPLAKGARLGRRDECRLRVIALSVVRDRYAENWTLIKRRLGETRHDVTVLPTPIDPGLGKFANLNRALEQVKLRDLDWIVLVDDDVILPAGFLDLFLLAAERYGLLIAQPAHRMVSHASWPITLRRPLTIARRTNFVEIGPVTAVHRHVFRDLIPFPEGGMGWGIDHLWARLARDHRWPIGIIDITPVVHLRPAAGTYSAAEAAADVETEPHAPHRTVTSFRRWHRGSRRRKQGPLT